MIFKGQTPLSKADISEEQREFLRSLWIESIEEALAAGYASSGMEDSLEQSGLKELAASDSALQAIAPERLSELQRARQGGGLGCIMDEEVLDNFRRHGRLRPTRPTPTGVFEAELPASVRLMDMMPAVRNQGSRGTCVAFATVALREYLLHDLRDLSEQFLYWACKELDGYPGSGTYVHTAMTALAQYGVCEENSWPYNPGQMADEGQGPPLPGAREDATQYRLESTRTVEPGLVIHFKNVLAGENSQDGMPVIFGVLVFNSWYMSAETHRTGKITMPLPGEAPNGGHAMCIVGYVDDEDVPGGGYFIVRNSWGESWAYNSPEAPGHALIPYEYVERYANEAFTGPTKVGAITPGQDDSERSKYIRILDDYERDIDDSLRRPGTEVIYSPADPKPFKINNDANWVEFLKLDKTWTKEARADVWFPSLKALPEEMTLLADRCRSNRQKFLTSIDSNLTSSKNQPIPEVKALPFWFAVLAWEPRIRKVNEVADLTSQLVDGLKEMSGAPGPIPWPDEWRKWLTELNSLKVYAIKGMATMIHVVTGISTCLNFTSPSQPELVPPGPATIDLIQNVYKRWVEDQNKRPIFTFFTVASSLPWAESVTGQAGGNHWLMVSDLKKDGTFESSLPPLDGYRLSFRDFIDCLKPETRQDRISRIKLAIDGLLNTGYQGNIHVKLISKETGYPLRIIKDALFTLVRENQQDTDGYRVYTTDSGEIAIGRKTGTRGKTRNLEGSQQKWLPHLIFLVPAIGVGIWYARDVILGRQFDIMGFATMIPLAYTGEWLKTRFRFWGGNKE